MCCVWMVCMVDVRLLVVKLQWITHWTHWTKRCSLVRVNKLRSGRICCSTVGETKTKRNRRVPEVAPTLVVVTGTVTFAGFFSKRTVIFSELNKKRKLESIVLFPKEKVCFSTFSAYFGISSHHMKTEKRLDYYLQSGNTRWTRLKEILVSITQ